MDDDGDHDLNDFLIFKDNYLTFSPWYLGPPGSGAALPFVDIENPPQVIDVVISGSNSTHAAYSFADAPFAANLRRVPVGGADTIAIEFSEDVNVVAEYLRVVGLYTANVPTLVEFNYDMIAKTATWRFDGWAEADQYVIMLDDAVTDVEGGRLDGEWTNNGSVYGSIAPFPSGNDDAGGDFSFIFTLLPGDAHPDGIVDSTDDSYWWSYYGMQQGATFDNADFDGDGDVDIDDNAIWSANFGDDLTDVWILGDLDGDFDVDQADGDIMNANFGMTGATWANGDLNGDGQVNAADADLFFAQFGIDIDVVS